MTLKTSCFSVSGAIIKADIRKYWGIPVLSTVVLFLMTVFYVLVNYRNILSGDVDGYVASSIHSILTFDNPMALFWIFAITIGSSLLVFSYLMSSGPVMSVHSQPFTRSILINSHSISAFLFSAVPMLICGLLLLVLARPVYYPESYYDPGDEMINLFDRMDILQWMWQNLVVILFVLAISIAAAMITGTVLHHGIAAMGFNIVVPSCMLLLSWHMEIFINGYTVTSDFYKAVCKTMPAAEAIQNNISAVEGIVYILVSVAIYVLASFLYQRRRVERATDGVVFRSVGVLITWIFGYLGMSFCGLLAKEIFNTRFLTTLGYLIGAVLGMIICRMIILKTAKVLNRNTVKIMGVFGIAAVLFFGGLTICDGWYAGSKPAISSIGSAEVSDYMLSNSGYSTFTDETGVEVRTEEGIKAVMALQDALVSNRADRYGSNENRESITITYRDKEGAELLSRRLEYTSDPDRQGEIYDAERALVSLPEIKQNMIDRFDREGAIESVLSIFMGEFAETSSDYNNIVLNRDLDGLGDAIAADIRNRDYADMYDNEKFTVVHMTLQMSPTKEDIAALRKQLNREPEERDIRNRQRAAQVNISMDDVNTLNWLAGQGINYLDYIDFDSEVAVIYKDGGMDPQYGGNDPYNMVTTPDEVEYEDSRAPSGFSAPVADGSRILVEKEKIPELVKFAYKYNRTDGVDSSLFSGVTFLFRDSDGNYYASNYAYIKKSDIARFEAA